MITDPLFYLCAIPAVLLFGMSKGGLGGGPAMLSVPMMALVISPLQAAAILLPLLMVMDAVAVWTFRRQWSSTQLKLLLPGALLGVAIGTLTFRYISEDGVRLMIAVIALVFSLDYYLKRYLARRRNQREIVPMPPSKSRASLWGAVSGYTSFAIHAGGPPVLVYMLPLRLEKRMLMATLALFFAVVNFAKLPPYIWLGQFSTDSLLASLVLVPFAPAGVRLGYYLLHKVSENFIYEISYLFLIAVGIKLGLEGLSGIL